MVKLTVLEKQVYEALINEIENEKHGTVYLDNVKHKLIGKQFSGVLSSLAKKGLYKYDGETSAFGYVTIVDFIY